MTDSDVDRPLHLDPHLNSDPGEGADSPGRDGVVDAEDTDPDRREVRAEVGKYVSLATYPATASELAEAAAANGAGEDVVGRLRALGGTTFQGPQEVWPALGLESSNRF
jgi:hypothetical protein